MAPFTTEPCGYCSESVTLDAALDGGLCRECGARWRWVQPGTQITSGAWMARRIPKFPTWAAPTVLDRLLVFLLKEAPDGIPSLMTDVFRAAQAILPPSGVAKRWQEHGVDKQEELQIVRDRFLPMLSTAVDVRRNLLRAFSPPVPEKMNEELAQVEALCARAAYWFEKRIDETPPAIAIEDRREGDPT